ncbi:hypothetical protein LRF89_06650 [Halorhodospira sp. 9621]|uniref:hypothetical protein n=1 Tax=Halorhodospira TaxID=85108 RepID=UPI001912F2C4|nr:MULTISPECIES: hypothetical protein [Halorhodospira]MBK5943334.1 hypothetical protein [Halorhodospira halophila]MCG5533120.1 hypothetical protein [Halorhodospira sp. 9621]MCG5537875.1 hypothetical protein [Halorhodospira sp. 9622]
MIDFELPEPTILLNRWQRMHWRDRRRHTEAVAWMVRAAVTPPAQPVARCQVHIQRYSERLPDWDGLYGGLKPLLDCLVRPTKRNPHGLGIIEDDDPQCIVRLTAEPTFAPRKKGWTRVQIVPVEGEGEA